MYFYLAIFIFVSVFIYWFLVVLKHSKNKKITDEEIILFEKLLRQYAQIPSGKTRIVDYDKLYHKILHAAGYNGTFWEILKLKPKVIPDLQKIWDLHKLRNKLVHDFDHIDEAKLLEFARDYEREVNKLLDRVS